MPISPAMKYSEVGLLNTEHWESCVLEAYPDPGTGGEPWTIGWGHTSGVRPGDTCTQAEADTWLLQDVQWAVKAVNKYVNVPVTQGQFDALVDFVFNVGETQFSGSTLLRKLNIGDYKSADAEFDKWILAGGKVLKGLQRRRDAGQALFDDEGPTTA